MGIRGERSGLEDEQRVLGMEVQDRWSWCGVGIKEARCILVRWKCMSLPLGTMVRVEDLN